MNNNVNLNSSTSLKEVKDNQIELYEAFSVEELEERLDLASSSSNSNKCPHSLSKCLLQIIRR